MIYREQLKIPSIHFCNDDYRNQIDAIDEGNTIIVTDPPFNINYHYNEYKDNMDEGEYYSMLAELIARFPCVIVHYPEALHRLSYESGVMPEKVCAWVYNSNTARQHRDIAWYGVKPDFTKTLQPFKNPNDKRIRERMSKGIRGGANVRLVERQSSEERRQRENKTPVPNAVGDYEEYHKHTSRK